MRPAAGRQGAESVGSEPGDAEREKRNEEGRKDMGVGRYKNFEELHAYERARELTNRVYALTRAGSFAKDFGLRDQIRRAAVSGMSNIAEGFERGSKKEFTQFLYIAKGSCAEVRAQLLVALDQGYCGRADYDEMAQQCRRLSGMLANLIKHLRTSESNSRHQKVRRQ